MKKYRKEFLFSLYRSMLRIRLCEESFVEPIFRGEIICPVHLCTGQEAVSAGVGAALKKSDVVFGNHRSHGHYLAKGGSIDAMVAEVYGKPSGCARGRGGSMHLVAPEVNFLGAAPIVGGTISLAAGAALAAKIRKDKSAAVSFFGDGATGEGALYESVNLSALMKLPILFVCENNLYATHMPILGCRPSKAIAPAFKRMVRFCRTVDGNDVLAVYESAREALDDCRAGHGPAFIEYRTYRMRGHVGPDDNIQGCHTDIRPKSEIAAWARKDPLERFAKYLVSRGLYTAKEIAALERSISSEVLKAHDRARRCAPNAVSEIKNYVFAK